MYAFNLFTVPLFVLGGYAGFTNLIIHTPGQNYFLIFSSSITPVLLSPLFDLNAGVPKTMTVSAQPIAYRLTDQTSLEMPVQPELTITDQYGNAVQINGGWIQASLSSCSPSSTADCQSNLSSSYLLGTTSMHTNTSQNVIVFTDLRIVSTGAYIINFVFNLSIGESVISLYAQSQVFEVYPGALKTVYLVRSCPQNSTCGTAGSPITTQPLLNLVDAYQNLIDTEGFSISVTIPAFLLRNETSDPSSSVPVLVGNTTIAVVNGMAAFTDLQIDRVSTADVYQFDHPIPRDMWILFFSVVSAEMQSPALPSLFSSAFYVQAGKTQSLQIFPDGSQWTILTAFTALFRDEGGFVVNAVDHYGNLVLNEDSRVSVQFIGPYNTCDNSNQAQCPLAGQLITEMVAGVANFTDVRINVIVLNSRLKFCLGENCMIQAFSRVFNTSFSVKLVLRTQPLASTAGSQVKGWPTVFFEDTSSQAVVRPVVQIIATLAQAQYVGTGLSLTGNTTLTSSSSSDVQFQNLIINRPGTYKLNFSVVNFNRIWVATQSFSVGLSEETLFCMHPNSCDMSLSSSAHTYNAGDPFQIDILITDVLGNRLPTGNISVGIFGLKPSQAFLTTINSSQVVNGRASFRLMLNKSCDPTWCDAINATGYQIQFKMNQSVQDIRISIRPQSTQQYALQSNIAEYGAGMSMYPNLQVNLLDKYSNLAVYDDIPRKWTVTYFGKGCLPCNIACMNSAKSANETNETSSVCSGYAFPRLGSLTIDIQAPTQPSINSTFLFGVSLDAWVGSSLPNLAVPPLKSNPFRIIPGNPVTLDISNEGLLYNVSAGAPVHLIVIPRDKFGNALSAGKCEAQVYIPPSRDLFQAATCGKCSDSAAVSEMGAWIDLNIWQASPNVTLKISFSNYCTSAQICQVLVQNFIFAVSSATNGFGRIGFYGFPSQAQAGTAISPTLYVLDKFNNTIKRDFVFKVEWSPLSGYAGCLICDCQESDLICTGSRAPCAENTCIVEAIQFYSGAAALTLIVPTTVDYSFRFLFNLSDSWGQLISESPPLNIVAGLGRKVSILNQSTEIAIFGKNSTISIDAVVVDTFNNPIPFVNVTCKILNLGCSCVDCIGIYDAAVPSGLHYATTNSVGFLTCRSIEIADVVNKYEQTQAYEEFVVSVSIANDYLTQSGVPDPSTTSTSKVFRVYRLDHLLLHIPTQPVQFVSNVISHNLLQIWVCSDEIECNISSKLVGLTTQASVVLLNANNLSSQHDARYLAGRTTAFFVNGSAIFDDLSISFSGIYKFRFFLGEQWISVDTSEFEVLANNTLFLSFYDQSLEQNSLKLSYLAGQNFTIDVDIQNALLTSINQSYGVEMISAGEDPCQGPCLFVSLFEGVNVTKNISAGKSSFTCAKSCQLLSVVDSQVTCSNPVSYKNFALYEKSVRGSVQFNLNFTKVSPRPIRLYIWLPKEADYSNYLVVDVCVSHSVPSKLIIIQQPSGAVINFKLQQQPIVALLDDFGNIVSSNNYGNVEIDLEISQLPCSPDAPQACINSSVQIVGNLSTLVNDGYVAYQDLGIIGNKVCEQYLCFNALMLKFLARPSSQNPKFNSFQVQSNSFTASSVFNLSEANVDMNGVSLSPPIVLFDGAAIDFTLDIIDMNGNILNVSLYPGTASIVGCSASIGNTGQIQLFSSLGIFKTKITINASKCYVQDTFVSSRCMSCILRLDSGDISKNAATFSVLEGPANETAIYYSNPLAGVAVGSNFETDYYFSKEYLLPAITVEFRDKIGHKYTLAEMSSTDGFSLFAEINSYPTQNSARLRVFKDNVLSSEQLVVQMDCRGGMPACVFQGLAVTNPGNGYRLRITRCPLGSSYNQNTSCCKQGSEKLCDVYGSTYTSVLSPVFPILNTKLASLIPSIQPMNMIAGTSFTLDIMLKDVLNFGMISFPYNAYLSLIVNGSDSTDTAVFSGTSSVAVNANASSAAAGYAIFNNVAIIRAPIMGKGMISVSPDCKNSTNCLLAHVFDIALLSLSTQFDVLVLHSFPAAISIVDEPRGAVEGQLIFGIFGYVTVEITDAYGNKITCPNGTVEELALLYQANNGGEKICSQAEALGVFKISVSLLQGCLDLGPCNNNSQLITDSFLLGNTNQYTLGGMAIFSDISITSPGQSFRLRFSAIITSGKKLSFVKDSEPFDIFAKTYNKLIVNCYERTIYKPSELLSPQPAVTGVFYVGSVINGIYPVTYARSNTDPICSQPNVCDPKTTWFANILVYSGPDPGPFSCNETLGDTCISAQGAYTVKFSNQSASFQDLRAPAAAGQMTLRIEILGPQSQSGIYADCPPITVYAGSAASIVVITQPSQRAVAGAPLLLQPSLKVFDDFGNLVDNSVIWVKASLCYPNAQQQFVCELWTAESCTLFSTNQGLKKASRWLDDSCPSSESALQMSSACSVSGVLTFSDLTITRAGTEYFLFFSVEGNEHVNTSSYFIDVDPCSLAVIAPVEPSQITSVCPVRNMPVTNVLFVVRCLHFHFLFAREFCTWSKLQSVYRTLIFFFYNHISGRGNRANRVRWFPVPIPGCVKSMIFYIKGKLLSC